MPVADPIRWSSRKQLRVSWLAEVKDYGPSLDYLRPIWFEERTIRGQEPMPPPHRHSYFEFGIILEGSVKMMIGVEEMNRDTGQLFIAGPAMPHSARKLSQTLRYCVIYFQPWILLESGTRDALQILSRFVAGQPIHRYLIPLSKRVKSEFLEDVIAIKKENEEHAFAWDLQQHALVVRMLVRLVRIDLKRGRIDAQTSAGPRDWMILQNALSYIHSHFSEPLYGRKFAKTLGISESHLQNLFRTLMGMSWVSYLQHYRIQRSTVLLSNPSTSISEAALAVGYESISHFNSTFLALTGVSPSQYRNS